MSLRAAGGAGPSTARRLFIRHNLIAASGTWTAGLLGLLLQALVSHHFRPALFGEVFTVFNVFAVILTGPAAAFGRMVAWNASQERSQDPSVPETTALLRVTNNRMLVIGAAIAVACIGTAPSLSTFLNVPLGFIVIGACGVPFMLATAPLLALLQGERRWLPWSALNVGIALSRLVFVAAFLYPFGIYGVVLGLSVGSAAIYLVALAVAWPALRRTRSRSAGWRSRWRFLVVSNASTLMMSLLAGSDVILVQHFFAGRAAGQYGAVVVTSRALYFAMNSVGSVLFPTVAARHAGSRTASRAVAASILLALGGGLVGLVVFTFGGHYIIGHFSGRPYETGGTAYSGIYALGMPMLAAVLMLSNTQQTLSDLRLLWVLVVGAALKPALILFFHDSLFAVAVASDVAIGAVLVLLATRYVLVVLRHGRVAARTPAVTAAAASVPIQTLQPRAPWPSPAQLPPPVSGLWDPAFWPQESWEPQPQPQPQPQAPPPPPPPPPSASSDFRDAVAIAIAAARAAVAMPGARPTVVATGLRAASSTSVVSSVVRQIAVELRRLTRWTVDRPWLTAAALAVTGLALRHSWLTTQPLAAGDWHFTDRLRVASGFPWPSIWDSNWGLGGENRFLSAFRFPAQAVEASLATVGANWAIIEKVIFFIPLAVVLPVAGWLLSREIMGRTRWSLLTPLLLLGNTYFLVVGDGEPPLALAEACSLFALFAFMRAMRRRSLAWAVATGLLVALTSTFDVRPTYLSILMMALYFVILAVTERDLRLLLRRTLLGGVTGVAFAGSQAFWLLPLLTYHGNPGLPIPDAPNFTILTLSHGIAGVGTQWTGGLTAQFVEAPLNPLYMIIPLLALAPLLARRISREVAWLAIIALFFALMAKTNNPPLGGLYDWMYLHVPGWKLFREGSKFLYPVGIAYAMLIPIGLRSGFAWIATRRANAGRVALYAGAATALTAVIGVSCSTIGVLQSGALESTTQATSEPQSFSMLSATLAADSRPGSLLWFGKSLVAQGTHVHHFVIGSPQHPMVNLTGAGALAKTNQRDPFQLFCTDQVAPYCYLDSQLFPYLLRTSGAGYIIAPGGPQVGSLPNGITREWLRNQIGSVLGPPQTYGSGSESLLVWRLASVPPAVTTAPAVADVESGTWATTASLPALEALNVPAVYKQTFNSHQDPVSKTAIPDSVGVMPRVDGGCSGTAAAQVGVMARTTSASLSVTSSGVVQHLQLLTPASQLSGWSVYGPMSIPAGETSMAATGASSAVQLGPCVEWSPVTRDLIAGTLRGATPTGVTGSAEQVKATFTTTGQPWVALSRYYDPGWRLNGHTPTTVADGLFNLYHREVKGSTYTFSYSTLPWERIGEGVAAVFVLAAVGTIVWDVRRRRRPGAVPGAEAPSEMLLAPSLAARWIAAAGVALLGVTAIALTLEWFGIPSAAPWIGAYAADPYALDVGFGAASIGVLLVSLGIRFIADLRRRLSAPAEHEGRAVTPTYRAALASLLLSCVVVAGCAPSAADRGALLNEAQQAGTLAPAGTGSALGSAGIDRRAHQPELCIHDYTAALQAFPSLVSAYVGRGNCYVSGGKNAPAAVHDYSQALADLPSSAGSVDVTLRHAVAERAAGNRAAAKADYLRAASMPSATADQMLSAVDGLIAMQELPAAQAVYAAAVRTLPSSSTVHIAGADVAIAAGDDQRAQQELVNAELLSGKSSSERAAALGRICSVDVLAHTYDSALIDCQTAAQLSTDGSGSYDNLSVADLALGNPRAARQDVDSAIGALIGSAGQYAQPTGVDGFGLASLYEARGWIDLELHSRSDAIADFQRALASFPGPAPNGKARIKGDISDAKVD